MKLIVLIFICILLQSIYAQDNTWNAFYIEKCNIKKYIYPWGEELSLEIKGDANPQLANEQIEISLYFENHIFKSYYIPLKQSKYSKIPFSFFKDPVNTPTQEIMPGNYKVTITLIVNNSNQEKIDQLSQGKKIDTYKHQFSIGTEEEKKLQSKENKIFYLRKIKELNNILDDIFIQQKFVFQPTRKNNPYYKTVDKFEMQEWRDWFQRVKKQLEECRLDLEQYQNKILALIYFTTHNYLTIYISLLEDIAGQYANAVYRFKKDPDAKFVPPYRMDELYEELNDIYNMHQEMQKELKVNLKKVLGYFPPPPVLRP